MEKERIKNDHLFDISGPSHLTAVDWKNPDHCRSIAACLVQGTYILEHDHSSSRRGISRALATPWWSTFNFRLSKVLQDDGEETYGAIYELDSSHQYAPKYVIAFRGTILNREHIKDVRLDLNIIFNSLHHSSRVELGLEAVHDVATHAAGTDSNVWIVGHSLGAAIGLLVGKKMKKRGYVIETYLFNSPFISLPIELIKSKRLKRGIHFAHSVAKSTLAHAHVSIKERKKKHGEGRDMDEFWATMSDWRPRLFVNPSDFICSEYIGYFEGRQKTRKGMTGRIGHKIEMVATQTSLKNLVSKKLGRDSGDPFYLLPSANLTVNISDQFSCDHLRAHSINQWWNPNYNFQSTLHQFDC